MGDRHLPYSLPDIGEEEIASVTTALRSGWVSSGPLVPEFERRFAEQCGTGVVAVAVNSATAGLHLALEALAIGPGMEVLVPTWTWTASAEIVVHLGADPVFVDVDPETLALDLDAAAAAVTARTAAVIPVHFAGRPISGAALRSFAASHGLAVVEDAAHAFPAASAGVPVGGGDSSATVFSFYATKPITTGEGGMVVTRDASLAARVRTMRLHGLDRDAYARYRSERPAWQLDVVAAGFKYNLTDPAAALGLVQLRRAEQMRARREWIAERYREAFADLPLDLPAPVPGGDQHAWHIFEVRIRPDAPIDRDRFVDELSRMGVSTGLHFIPLHTFTYWRTRYALTDEMFPVASREFSRVVSLPLFSAMSDAQVDLVAGVVRKALQ
ncbi:DegT/DnrJ/EryC1/StrS family aminotransferase [Plantactinospora sp. GCM10030261]|uniref:DegT/DnrJ/EryC1/StrS family aminotransferase n=1 Tax=Plantactinospora sp. GCM10030261 TaxID=3273420 RepID=UPI0036118F1E